MRKVESWGRYPKVNSRLVKPAFWREDLTDLCRYEGPVLAYACGRSYGDSCLNDAGVLIDTSFLNRFLCFDETNGILRCEAGVTLAEILEVALPTGWFLPVTPGTKFVSVGGAIANDIHGKNHHKAGTFGCHVTQFELLRSSGERILCSPTQNTELFQATIGGLGLTGLILWAEIKLKPIVNSFIDKEQIRFNNLSQFFELANESDHDFEYTVAWMDCLNGGQKLGRGLFMRGNHNQSRYLSNQARKPKLPLQVPFDLPSGLVNPLSMRVFNTLVYNTQLTKRTLKVVSYDPFFYPLDSVKHWNRFYKSLLQYQCVVPNEVGEPVIREMIKRISAAGEGSFLMVIKKFGDVKSPGMLSFPRPGITLAMDFPNRGSSTLRLLDELDAIVRDCGGALYPAKDARMSGQSFELSYPNWRDFTQYIDPKFSSNMWRRLTANL